MWCTSRASPHSTTSPTRVRVLARIRWWCTAAVSSRLGIGALVLLESRSESTRMGARCSTASSPGGGPEDASAPLDRLLDVRADLLDARGHRLGAAGDVVEAGDLHRREVRHV